jgi:hypothetical protein
MSTFDFRRALISAFAFSLAACGSDSAVAPGPIASPSPTPSPAPTPTPTPTPTPAPASVERSVLPAQTSSAININLSPHFVINPDPAVTARNRLFVMLPGTLAVPNTYREIVRTGASRGYHAIGLTYPNDDAIEGLCGNSSDPDCAGRARREVITGENTSTLVAVNEANSITTRLIRLLEFLNASFPTEGWGQYLANGQPVWSRITIAGHSQGGGHAGFFAKLVELDRAVMFSAPGDTGVAVNSAAQWTALPNITPTSRQYGFTHVNDNLAPLANVSRNWQAIGLGAFGPLFSVDGQSSPFGNSRQLTTEAAPNPNPTGPSASPTHGAPVVDAVTPRDVQGRPIFTPVWIYLAFP